MVLSHRIDDASRMHMLTEIGRQWDRNVQARAAELSSGSDLSYRSLCNRLVKIITNNVPVGSKVVDLGCGLGFLANELRKRRYRVTGIDVSVESIRFARSAFPRVEFEAVSVEEYARSHPSSFAACMANMFLHNSPYLEESLRAASTMLGPQGILVVTIPNPVFHLGYRGEPDVPSRSNSITEFSVELPFRIKGGKTHPGLVTYFHRDLATYYKALARAGLSIVDVDVPTQIGPGKPNDVLIILARKEG